MFDVLLFSSLILFLSPLLDLTSFSDEPSFSSRQSCDTCCVFLLPSTLSPPLLSHGSSQSVIMIQKNTDRLEINPHRLFGAGHRLSTVLLTPSAGRLKNSICVSNSSSAQFVIFRWLSLRLLNKQIKWGVKLLMHLYCSDPVCSRHVYQCLGSNRTETDDSRQSELQRKSLVPTCPPSRNYTCPESGNIPAGSSQPVPPSLLREAPQTQEQFLHLVSSIEL